MVVPCIRTVVAGDVSLGCALSVHTWAETVPGFIGNRSVGMHRYGDHVFLNGDGIIEVALTLQKLFEADRRKKAQGAQTQRARAREREFSPRRHQERH